MSLKDDLIAAKALIDSPEKWWKGGDSAGEYCSLTACQRVGRHLTGVRIFSMTNALSDAISGRDVQDFNDDPRTTHADIMALFDRAIEAAP